MEMNLNKRKMLSNSDRLLVLKWKAEGIKQVEIANRLGVTPRCVSYVLKTYSNDDFNSKKSNCGRKPILCHKELSELNKVISADRFTTGTKLAMTAGNIFHKAISPKTAKRYANYLGFQAMTPRKVALLSKKNRNARLEFAKKYIVKPKSFWKDVIWSDESKINLFSSDGKIWVWRRIGERLSNHCTVKTVKHNGGNIMIWGCIGANGVGSLTRIEGKMDSAKYISILQEHLIPSVEKLKLEDFIFQQDNDPKHKSRLTSSFFQCNHIKLLEWPSQSPDLNVIEHVWSYVKRKYAECPANNCNEAYNKIKEIWGNIPREFVEKLVNSIYERLSEVIRNNGGATDF